MRPDESLRRSRPGPTADDTSAPEADVGASHLLEEGVWRTSLPGGPVVLSERIDAVRSAAVGIWFRQGAVHEPPEMRGASHLLEHMVFKGTRRRSARQLALEVESVGGAVDAYTTHEATVFQARVPDHRLKLALDVLADMAFEPALREADLAVERDVILEELAGLEEVPEEVVFERHASFLYGPHPYGQPIIGTRETVASLGLEQLAALHTIAYTRGNAIVAAAGRVEHEELVASVRRLFADARPGERPAPPGPASNGGTGLRTLRQAGIRQAHVVAAGLTSPYRDPRRYAIVLVTTALGGGMSSRLFQKIREESGLAYNVYSFHSFYAAAGHAGAYLGTNPEKVSSARDLLLEELRAIAEDGLEREEIETTREQLKGRLMISLESPVTRMNRLAGTELYGEPYRTLEELAGRVDGITLDEIRWAAGRLHPERLAVMELVPEREADDRHQERRR